jgi:hypothetical protein
MSEAPADLTDRQLKEVFIKLDLPEKVLNSKEKKVKKVVKKKKN